MDPLKVTYKVAKRIVISIVGSTVLLIGVIMLVTPGPALIVIPLGLAILGLEFAWARSWMRRLRQTISERGQEIRTNKAETHRQRHTDIRP
jgi:tellurite resistance protein TerC